VAAAVGLQAAPAKFRQAAAADFVELVLVNFEWSLRLV
jgi:hypothetical protein